MADQQGGTDRRTPPPAPVLGRLAAAWRRLDRGWRAVLLGLVIVLGHFLWQLI